MKTIKIKSNLIKLIIFLLFISSGYSQEQKQPDLSIRVLFVGNSYIFFGDLPGVVQSMAQDKGLPLISEKSTAGGTTLEHHRKEEKGLKTCQLIKSGKYNAVILQDQSKRPIDFPEKTIKDIGLLCEKIKNSGATPYLFLTWPRKKTPKMQRVLTQTYMRAAHLNHAEIVPVGLAWELALKLRPDLSLYQKDGSHPSELGTYLSACVFYSVLTKKSPMGLINQSTTLNQKDAKFCQQVAKETINAFKSRPAAFPDRCVGRWKGLMFISGNGKLKNSVPVKLTVAKTSDPEAWIWKTEYFSKKSPAVKDYVLRLKDKNNNIYILDEGDNLVLFNYLFENKLYCVFETEGILLTASYELRGEELIFEVTSGKKLKNPKKGVTSFSVTNLQRVIFKKVN